MRKKNVNKMEEFENMKEKAEKSEENIEVKEEILESNEIVENEKENEMNNIKNEVKDLKKENKKVIEENKKLENELNAIKDRLMRIDSEYENFRKRTEGEKKAIYNDACSDVLKNILPVFDNLERAMMADGNAEDLKTGLDITMKQLEKAFEKLEIEEIETNGEFDPNYHSAIMHIEDDNYDKNQVVEVFQKGFKRKDKVLRFSVVKVAN